MSRAGPFGGRRGGMLGGIVGGLLDAWHGDRGGRAPAGRSTDDSAPDGAAPAAVAALLVEVCHADFVAHPDELQVAARRLAERCQIDAPAAAARLRAALAAHQDSVSIYDHIRVINQRFDAHGKAGLLEDLWAVAFGDGVADPREEGVIRKIAGLLHTPHAHFTRARHRAQPGD